MIEDAGVIKAITSTNYKNKQYAIASSIHTLSHYTKA